jgi:hypothetical protein
LEQYFTITQSFRHFFLQALFIEEEPRWQVKQVLVGKLSFLWGYLVS